ncbi:HvfX family Cu-binding RiPP maturation protein [Sulfurirhabdus autotrophica]|nr:DoxX family protein [Sulfurirhabdus autotrophica]
MGNYFPQLLLRLFLAYEFLESGLMKFNGTNWFSEIQSDFPFPFSIIPPEISWQIATWFELIGPVALILGLGTRFFSASLIILTIVAWVAVHAGNGYNFSNNGYKLALIYLIMFTPLLFKGAGKLSIDHLLSKRFASNA